MSQTVVLLGQSYTIPDQGDEDWGDAVTAYLVALASAQAVNSGGRVRYKASNGQAFTTAATLVLPTQDYDTLSEYNPSTGVFTATTTGYYSVAVSVGLQSIASPPVGSLFQVLLQQGGSVSGVVARGPVLTATGAPQTIGCDVKTTLSLQAGDTLIAIFSVNLQGSGDTVTLQTNSSYNWMTVEKLP